MTTIRIRTTIEVDGALTADGGPGELAWGYDCRTLASPRLYGDEVRKAVEEAHAAVCRGLAGYPAAELSPAGVDQ